jgi:hypothetical protein
MLGEALDAADDVLPGLAAVPGHLEVPVVRSAPEGPFVYRRFRDRHDRAMDLGAGILERDRSSRVLLFGRVVSG